LQEEGQKLIESGNKTSEQRGSQMCLLGKSTSHLYGFIYVFYSLAFMK